MKKQLQREYLYWYQKKAPIKMTIKQLIEEIQDKLDDLNYFNKRHYKFGDRPYG